MPKFLYSAYDQEGKKIKGSLDSRSKSGAIENLLANGITPVSILKANDFGQIPWWHYQRQGISESQTGSFCIDLSKLLASGYSLFQSLQMIAVTTEFRQIKALSSAAAEKVNEGEALSAVLDEVGDPQLSLLANLVRAGENSGRLEYVLDSASRSYKAQAEFKEKLRSALIYPTLLLFMIALTLIIFFAFVLPSLAPLFEDSDQQLPLATRILFAVASIVQRYSFVPLVGALIIMIGYMASHGLRKKLNEWGNQLLLSPITMNISALLGCANYGRTMGLLLEAGVVLPRAHELASGTTTNGLLREQYLSITSALREGQKLSLSLSKISHVPPLFLRMIAIGERSSKLDQSCHDAAALIERKARNRLDRFLTLLTPLITISLGLVVAFVVGALFLGISSLTDVGL